MEHNLRQAFVSPPMGGPAQPPMELGHGRTEGENAEGRRQDDERIRLAVMTALQWDVAVPRDRVAVRVERGWITLTGQVSRGYEKSRAEADARTVSGVVGVTNEIDCKAAG